MGTPGNEKENTPSGSPEARAHVLRATLEALVQEGFTEAEIRAALAERDPLPTSDLAALGATEVTFVSKGLRDLVRAVGASPHQAGSKAKDSAPRPTHESVETSLEADPFSIEAILRVNQTYNFTPQAKLEEFLKDDDYAFYHGKLQAAKCTRPERICLAQQFICKLPTLPEAKRRGYVEKLAELLEIRDAYPFQRELTKPLDKDDQKLSASQKAAILRGENTARHDFNDPTIDFLHRLNIATDSSSAPASYAMVRLFQRGALGPYLEDEKFIETISTTQHGFFNMVTVDEATGQLYLLDKESLGRPLPEELSQLVIAEAKKICLELLPTLNYLKASNPFNLGLLRNMGLSGLKETSQGNIVSSARGNEVTKSSQAADQLGLLWYKKGQAESKKAWS